MLPRVLKELGCFLNMIPNINSGGCGVSALAIYRECQRQNIPAKIMAVYFNDFIDDFEYNLERLEDNNHKLITPSHILVEACERFLDSNMWNIGCIWKFRHEINETQLINMIKDDLAWNRKFDRKTYLPVIEAYMELNIISNIPRSDIVNAKKIMELIRAE